MNEIKITLARTAVLSLLLGPAVAVKAVPATHRPAAASYPPSIHAAPPLTGLSSSSIVIPLHLTVLPSGGTTIGVKPSSDDKGETPAPGKAVVQLAPADATFDFGQPSPLLDPRIEHAFVLRNDAKAPLTIQQLQTSCGCTHAAFGETSLPLTLAPGQKATLTVSLNAAELGSSDAAKYIWVFAHGQSAPAVTLAVTGRAASEFQVSPRTLDFGTATGSQSARTLTVTLSPRLLAAGIVPRLTSANPDVQITPGSPQAPLSVAPSGKVQMSTASASGAAPAAVETYHVTVSPKAHPGSIKGTVTVSLTQAGTNGLKDMAVILVPLAGQVPVGLPALVKQGDVMPTPTRK